jgi:HlyD family secretion protein
MPFKKKAIFIGALVCLISLGVFWKRHQTSDPVPYTAMTHSTPLGIGAMGILEPRSRILRIAHDMGRERAVVIKLLVEEGQEVQKNQVLAEFSDYPRKIQEAKAAQAKLDACNAHIEAGKTDIAFQTKEYTRQKELVARNAGIASKRDEVEHRFHKSVANLKALMAERLEAEAKLALALAGVHQSEVRAPQQGTILKIYARPGEQLGPEGIANLADLDHIDVVAEIHERDMPKIKAGQEAEIMVPGLSQEHHPMPIKGVVKHLGFQIKKNTLSDPNPRESQDVRVVEVRIELSPHDSKRLQHFMGMQVFVRLL